MIWRRVRRDERLVADLWFGVVFLCLLLLPLWHVLAPVAPSCALRSVTGVPCPTCGTTRALTAIIEGSPFEAALLNPLAILALAVFVAGGLVAPVWARTVGALPVTSAFLSRSLRIAAVLALIANWGWLVLTGV